MNRRTLIPALAAVAALAAFAPARAGCSLKQFGELPVTMSGLIPITTVKIDGTEVRLMADSGAFYSMLTREGAKKLGLKVFQTPVEVFVKGAGGFSDVGITEVKSLDVAGIRTRDAQFLVGGIQFAPDTVGLLGQNLLGFADVEFDLANGVIRLFHPVDCGGAPLAYWAGSRPFSAVHVSTNTESDPQFKATATLNGVPIRVIFDTGAALSILTLKAAARAGVTPSGEGVTPSGETGGIGRRVTDTWIAPFASFKLGDEEIQHPRLRIGAIELEDADMLLGADFFLSHRVYASNAQHKLYFTYNGGHVFDLSPPKDAQGASVAASSAEPPGDAGAPTDAGGFRRRAAAFAARSDFPHAIADYTRASELDPKDERSVYERAVVRERAGEALLAVADLDQALKLKPDDIDPLLARGQLRRSGKDEAGARADFEVAAKTRPDDAALQLRIGATYEGAELLESSVEQYDQVIALKPDADTLGQALNGRCWSRALWGHDVEKGRADCDAALKLSPGSAQILDSRGLVRVRQGDFAGAVADYDRALKLRPQQAWSLYGRGLAELKLGRTAAGQADLAAAAALAPKLAEKAKRLGLAP